MRMSKLLIIGCLLWHVSIALAQNTYQFTVNPTVKYQAIDHFGASDCWTMYRFGKYATEENIDKVADLFLVRSSMKMDFRKASDYPCGV